MNTVAAPAGLALVADIGGTNARFALAAPGPATNVAAPALLQPQSLQNTRFASLQQAAEHYLSRAGARPRRAAIALACPVTGDDVRLTNRAWSFNRLELQAALGLDELRLVNDFGAVARAVPALGPDERVTLYGPPRDALRGPVSLLGPGTGLGVALLVGHAGAWHAVETEGGHVAFAPLGDEELAIARWTDARHGRTSWERVLSGHGLAGIDAALRGIDAGADAVQLRNPASIAAAALDGTDASARRALARFCAILGSVAGDIALVHGARTLVIAGGIVPRFIPFLRGSAFRDRFLDKGRFAAYLEQVAVQVVVHPHPGLLGAAIALRE